MSILATSDRPERGATLKELRLQWRLMNAYERFEQVVVLALGRDHPSFDHRRVGVRHADARLRVLAAARTRLERRGLMTP